MEVNFFDFNLHDDDKEFTPYVYSGINYFSYDLLYVPLGTGNDVVQKYDAAMEISIPAVVGVKASISPLFVLSFEAGIRYALTDNLDGSNPLMVNFKMIHVENTVLFTIKIGMSLLASHLVIPLAKFRVIVKKRND